MTCRSYFSGLLTIFFVAFLSLGASPLAGDLNPVLQAEAVTIVKTADVLSAEAEQFLQLRDSDMAAIWVFFSDKGVRTKAEYGAAASRVILDQRALARRKKVNLDHVVFADLPVVDEYVRAIVALGGEHRYKSRLLNAASFNVPFEQLAAIAGLPFVAEIRPIGHSSREIEPSPKWAQTVESGVDGWMPFELDYGYSLTQLENINVPSAHSQGLSGKGVLLSHFDTGYLTSHVAFMMHYREGRVLGARDFVQKDTIVYNQAGDHPDQQEHGTGTWSMSSGYWRDVVIGPAYRSSVMLAKTEWYYHEVEIEEDYWVAALEWSDSAGADVISSSLSYTDWYDYRDFDGQTAVTTLAVNLAADRGIVVCNSMGNEGPSYGSLNAPSDAHDMLACGAVDSTGLIAPFSSRGPTSDGRIKPDVVAQGMWVYCASGVSYGGYRTWAGTSFSAPLVAGCVCLMIEAHPNWHPALIIQAIKETADNALNPDSTYGWGMVNIDSALKWGPHMLVSERFSDTPLTVQFTGESVLPATDWRWDFGDGDSAFTQNPSHTYSSSGLYDVTVSAVTLHGDLAEVRKEFIAIVDDSLSGTNVDGGDGTRVAVDIIGVNSVPTYRIEIPFMSTGAFGPLLPDSFTVVGCRTSDFELVDMISADPVNGRATIVLQNNQVGVMPYLDPGTGPVLRLYFTIPQGVELGQQQIILPAAYGDHIPMYFTEFGPYQARCSAGTITVSERCCDSPRGDVNLDRAFVPDIADLTYLLAYMFKHGLEPPCMEEADIDGSGGDIDISDMTYLVGFMFKGGPAPPDCD